MDAAATRPHQLDLKGGTAIDVVCALCGSHTEAHHLEHDMHRWSCRHGTSVTKWSDGRWHHRGESTDYGYAIPLQTGSPCDDPAPELSVKTADNGQVPPIVLNSFQLDMPGWLFFVTGGHGCPACYGKSAIEGRTL